MKFSTRRREGFCVFQRRRADWCCYKYSEKSEPVLKTDVENGIAKEPVTIDPVAVKKTAADRQAEWKAQQSFTLAR